MYIDIISYQLAKGITHEDLLKAAADIFETWMKKQPGFIKWEINQVAKDVNFYKDFVYWEDEASAKRATQNMEVIPSNHAWLGCYDMASVKSEPLVTARTFS